MWLPATGGDNTRSPHRHREEQHTFHHDTSNTPHVSVFLTWNLDFGRRFAGRGGQLPEDFYPRDSDTHEERCREREEKRGPSTVMPPCVFMNITKRYNPRTSHGIPSSPECQRVPPMVLKCRRCRDKPDKRVAHVHGKKPANSRNTDRHQDRPSLSDTTAKRNKEKNEEGVQSAGMQDNDTVYVHA